MSKHGGSPASGLVQPAGIDAAEVVPGSEAGLLIPELVKRNAEAKERARQFERRRIALEMLARGGGHHGGDVDLDVQWALKYADELMRQTGGFVTGAARE